jgi:hypothetical protein
MRRKFLRFGRAMGMRLCSRASSKEMAEIQINFAAW